MKAPVVLFTAASGELTARLGDGTGQTLFSAYHPRREAERFLAGTLSGRTTSVLVILGAGLGYLEEAAAAAAPGAEIIPVYYADELICEHVLRRRTAWRPGGDEPLELFLERALRGKRAREITVIEWPASSRAFPDLSRRARETVRRVLKENAYSDLTTAAVGRRWLRNTLANFLFIDSPVFGNPLDPTRPLVIAAAGPSLLKAVPLIARHRHRINLWAAASSLKALRSRGLEPDLVVSSDPGYYASVLIASGGGRIPLLAMPLSGARGAWRAADRVLLFAQPNFFEVELFVRSRAQVPAVDAHGTVAGTALLLAEACGSAAVFFCGLDCCYDDIRAHALPHPTDDMVLSCATRLQTAYGRTFARALEHAPERLPGGRRTSEPLSVYAASFQEPCGRGGLRAARLFPSPVPIPGMADADEEIFEKAVADAECGTVTPLLSIRPDYPDRIQRKRIIHDLLTEWRDGCAAGRPAPDIMRFFLRDDANASALGETAGFLDFLRRRFSGDVRHA